MVKGKRARAAREPRLDEQGYLLEAPGARKCYPAMWTKPSIGKKKIIDPADKDNVPEGCEVDLYDELEYNKKLVHLDDVVYLTPEEEGDACEIGAITALYDFNMLP